MSKNILLAVDAASHDPAGHVLAAAHMTRDLGYAFDDTEPLHVLERDESPLTRGTHPAIAARRLT